MQWIELIGVRAAIGHRERLEKILQDFLGEKQNEDANHGIQVFRRLSVASDLCVHLHHNSKKAEPLGSRLGLRLAAEMKAFGLVHHSIWVILPGIGQ